MSPLPRQLTPTQRMVEARRKKKRQNVCKSGPDRRFCLQKFGRSTFDDYTRRLTGTMTVSVSRCNATTGVAALTVAATVVWWWRRHQEPKQAKKRMSVDLQCSCGKVSVAINSAHPVHLVCYCDDCQNYAKWLSQKRDDAKYGPLCVVDSDGGARVCQVFRSDIQVLSGHEFLTCTALDPSLVPRQRPFQLLRVHAKCCQTPMFSACWRELPVVGFFVANVKKGTGFVSVNNEGVWGDEEDLLPAPEYRINTQWATNQKIKGNRGFPFGFLNRFLWRNFVVAPKSPCPWPLPEPRETVLRVEVRPGSKTTRSP